MTTLNPSEAFNRIYNGIDKVLEYNSKWNNGTGYFDYATVGAEAPKLAIGERAKCETPAPNSRRLIFVGTRLGNFVMFERFSPDSEGRRSRVITHNTTYELESLRLIFVSGCMGYDEIEMCAALSSSPSYNIGLKVEEIRNIILGHESKYAAV